MTNTAPIDAVAELIRRQKLRIDVTPNIGYWVTAPCLLAQLRQAVTLGTEGGTRGIPTSRPPVAVDAATLWYQIEYNTNALARHLGLNRRDTTPASPTPWIGRLLRHVAAEAVSRGLTKTADRIEHNALKWRTQILCMLTGATEQRSLRGAACPACTTTTVIEERYGDGTYRVPAIVLVTRQSLRWLVCQACGWSDPIVGGDPEVIHTAESLAETGPVVV